MKLRISIIITIITIAIFGFKLNNEKLSDPEKEKVLLEIVKYVVERGHYSSIQIDDDLSLKIFDDFINKLDPQRRFFTLSDIKELDRFKYKIDDQIKAYDLEFFEEIQNQGGYLATLDSGWLHARAAENQYQEFMDMESRDQQVIGVNCFQDDESPFEVDGFMGTDDAFDVARARLNDVLRTRHERAAKAALKQLEADCRSGTNIMPAMMEAMSAEVTLGEIGSVYREVFGNWNTPIQT